MSAVDAGLGFAAATLFGAIVGIVVAGGPLQLAVLAAALATAAAAAAVGESLWRRPEERGLALLAGGSVLAVALAFGAERSVLDWRFAAGGVEIAGTGIVLGVLLWAALAGTLALAADRLCPGASAVAARFGMRALMLAAGLGLIATVLIGRAAFADSGVSLAPLGGIAAIVAGCTALLAVTLALLLNGAATDATHHESRAALWSGVAASIAAVALGIAGYEAWQASGNALGGRIPQMLAAALAGVAAVQPTGWALARRTLFFAALVAAL